MDKEIRLLVKFLGILILLLIIGFCVMNAIEGTQDAMTLAD